MYLNIWDLDSLLNLKCLTTLKEKFNLPVGYSGHEPSVSPSLIAACLGATAIERHITQDRSSYGSDQAASLEEVGLKNLVDMVRKIPLVLGDGVKTITEQEKIIAKKLRYWLWIIVLTLMEPFALIQMVNMKKLSP